MSVKAQVAKQGQGRVVYETVARDLLDKEHPLHKPLQKFCGDKEVTLRQARKFLQKYPNFRGKGVLTN